MGRKRLFWRFLWRSLWRSPRNWATVLAAALGAAVLVAMFNLYLDMEAKMGRELRAYGANVVLVPGREQQVLEWPRLRTVLGSLPGQVLTGAAPFLYGVVSAGRPEEVILRPGGRALLVGTDMEELAKVKPYLSVSGQWPEADSEVLVGVELATALRLAAGEAVVLHTPAGKEGVYRVAGVVASGGEEDDQILMPLAAAQAFLERSGQVDGAWLSVLGRGQELDSIKQFLSAGYPGLEVTVAGQVARSEGNVLASLSTLIYLLGATMALATLLCLLTSMVTAMNERREEIGLKKALGATAWDVRLEFLVEAAILGLTGGLAGLGAGWVLTRMIGELVFGSPLVFRWPAVPLTLVITAAITLLAASGPVQRLVTIRPALVLRGE